MLTSTQRSLRAICFIGEVQQGHRLRNADELECGSAPISGTLREQCKRSIVPRWPIGSTASTPVRESDRSSRLWQAGQPGDTREQYRNDRLTVCFPRRSDRQRYPRACPCPQPTKNHHPCANGSDRG